MTPATPYVDDQEFDQLILIEQSSTPGTPDIGMQKLYIRTSDHALCLVDESGTVTVVAGGGSGGYTEGARVYNNANISIPNNSETALTFNTERYDTDTIHDTGTNPGRLTCHTAGKYQIIAHVEFAGNATGMRYAYIRLNGTDPLALESKAGTTITTASLNPNTIYELAENDYVEVMVYQNSGGNLNANRSAWSNEFMMQRVG